MICLHEHVGFVVYRPGWRDADHPAAAGGA